MLIVQYFPPTHYLNFVILLLSELLLQPSLSFLRVPQLFAPSCRSTRGGKTDQLRQSEALSQHGFSSPSRKLHLLSARGQY